VGPPIGAGVRQHPHLVRADRGSFDSAPRAAAVASESLPRTSTDRRAVGGRHHFEFRIRSALPHVAVEHCAVLSIREVFEKFRCRTDDAEVVFVREVNPESGDDLPLGIVSAFFRAPSAC
jgi:hypothetical protein